MKIVSCSELLIAILFALSFVVMGAEPESDSDLFWGELSIVENLAFADIAGIGTLIANCKRPHATFSGHFKLETVKH